MLRTSQEEVACRADELGVSLAISDEHEGLSTRERAVAAMVRRPATRTAEAGTRRPEVNMSVLRFEMGLFDVAE